jgi:hypothetical protein
MVLQVIEHDTIYRIAEATARLKLKDKVDSEIAQEVMQSMSLMLLQYGHIIKIIEDPREIACQEITNIIESKAPITFSEAVNIACQRNAQIKGYLGDKKNLTEDNKRFRDLREGFITCKDPRITITSLKPLALVWSENNQRKDNSTTDLNDPTDQIFERQNETHIVNPMDDKSRPGVNFNIKDVTDINDGHSTICIENSTTDNQLRSDRSDRSVMNSNQEKKGTTDLNDSTDLQQNFENDCYYCSFQTNNNEEYERHVVQKHWPKVAYPNKVSLEKMGIKGKDKPWEI